MKILTLAVKSIAIATTTVLILSVSATASNLSVGQTKLGSALPQDTSFTPPDTTGAVGLNQIVEIVNGRYTVYDKGSATTPPNLLASSTLDAFWANAGVTVSGGYSFRPRVVYDPFSNRWFASALDNPLNPNNFLLAVSKTSNPTDGWKGFAIATDSTAQQWADYDTLGFDKNGVYVGGNMFPLSSGSTNYGTTILAVPKSDLLLSTPTVANAQKFENLPLTTAGTGFTPQPVVNLDNSGTSEAVLSAYDTPNGLLKRSNITLGASGGTPPPGGPARLNTDPLLPKIKPNSSGQSQNNPSTTSTPQIPKISSSSIPFGFDPSPNLISITPYNPPVPAPQPSSPGNNIFTGDDRLSSNVVLKNGIFWGVQSVTDPNNRAALRWFKINAQTNTLLQEGLIDDPNSDYYYGSIAVNQSNQVVIGFNRSSQTEYVSSYAALGETDPVTGQTTFGNPLLLQSGTATYSDGFGNLWGDYSATVADPSNPSTFWTFQQIATGIGTWSTSITQLNTNQSITSVPEPNALFGLLAFGGLGGVLLKRKQD